MWRKLYELARKKLGIKTEGFYWHVHHDLLVEYCYDYDRRVQFIKESKPTGEIEERLRVLCPVEGKLPRALRVILRSYIVGDIYDAILCHKDELEKLHAKECPNCSWNGEVLTFCKEKAK